MNYVIALIIRSKTFLLYILMALAFVMIRFYPVTHESMSSMRKQYESGKGELAVQST